MSFQNVGFRYEKFRALSGFYTDTHDDGAVLYCFTFLFCVIVLIVLLCPRS